MRILILLSVLLTVGCRGRPREDKVVTVYLKWDASDGAIYYNAYRVDLFALRPVCQSTSTTCSFMASYNEVVGCYVVTAINEYGESPPSNEACLGQSTHQTDRSTKVSQVTNKGLGGSGTS